MLRGLFLSRAILPVGAAFFVLMVGAFPGGSISYDANAEKGSTTTEGKKHATSTLDAPLGPPPFVATHLPTPEPMRSAYMTACIASGKKLRAPLVKLIEETELNSVVIDIKDYTGMISFDTGDPRFPMNTRGCFVSDIKEFIAELHAKGIYVIGRVTVFQDTVYPKQFPETAVVRASDGAIWKDRKGITYIDPSSRKYWDYIVALAKHAHDAGFDEINFDYIRFPSDGNMQDIAFPMTGTTSKPVALERFFSYLATEMRKENIITSADLFGMTTTNTDDLNIGQVLERTLPHFDYVAPMVYPSHYPPNFNGWKDPNLVPYEIIHFAMSRAVLRADALEEKESGYVRVGTSTPPFKPTGKYAKKLRPWIQDFDYGKEYTEADVRAQKKATYDAGLTSWMAWDPSNKYTPSAYDKI